MRQQVGGRLIAIGGGKGGVGKSIVAANVAAAMAALGARVVLVDADLGAANQHTLFGMSAPGGGLQAFLDHEVETLAGVIVPTGIPRLSLVPGSGAVRGAANINHAQKQRLIRHIRTVEADVVLIDVGAGVHYNALDFFDLGARRLVVMTPQLTSIQNAYGFLKGALLRAVRDGAETPDERAMLDETLGRHETERVSEGLRRIATLRPALAERIRGVITGFGAGIVGNMVFSPAEGNVFASVSKMIKQFLDLEVPVLTTIPASRPLHESVNRRRPLVLEDTRDEAARALRRLAETLLEAPPTPAAAAEPRRRGTIEFITGGVRSLPDVDPTAAGA